MNQRNILLSCFFIALMGIVFSASVPVSCMAAVRARLDRQTISIDETVTLSIEADGALNSISSLDTSALEKDFSIVNQSTSSNFQIINGSSKATKTWTLELEPKHIGTFTIPSFTIHGEKSRPLTLKVTDHHSMIPGTSPVTGEAFVEVVPVMDTPAYLQGQITIGIKLFIKSQLNLSEASLEEPKLEHATVIKLGDDRRYQSRRNGIVYQVIERKYAIFPEEGKMVTIPPLMFQAVISSGGNRFFSSDPFFGRFPGQGRRLRTRSQKLEIPLTPIPKEFKGNVWLPARKLTITDDSTPPKELKVGEPLTRTIQLEATGLTAEQLPDIRVKAPDGCKIYLDQPELKNQVDGDYLRATKRQSIAFIPSKAGTFTLPEISIDWWDVVNNRRQKAVLPALTIKVAPAPGQQVVAGEQGKTLPTAQASRPTQTAKPETETGAVKKELSGKAANTDSVRLWQGICLTLLLLWLITLYFWYKSRQQQALDQQQRKKQMEKKPMADREQIKKACLANNPRQAHQAILDWAAATWPKDPPTNLKNLATKVGNAELGRVFAEFEKVLYSPVGNREWDGHTFWQTIAKKLQQKPSKTSAGKKEKRLPPLYSDL